MFQRKIREIPGFERDRMLNRKIVIVVNFFLIKVYNQRNDKPICCTQVRKLIMIVNLNDLVLWVWYCSSYKPTGFFFLFQNDSARVIATLNPQNVGEILNSFQDGIILRNKIKNGS